jgi:hypothetical protein
MADGAGTRRRWAVTIFVIGFTYWQRLKDPLLRHAG